MDRNGNELGNGIAPMMFGGQGGGGIPQMQGIPMHPALQGIPGLAHMPGMSMQGLHPAYMQSPHMGSVAQLGGMVVDPQSDMLATKPSPAPKFKKAPDAPKRFKSAFIIFSAEKHKLIKEELAKEGRAEKTTDIAKLVSEAWRQMEPDEKEAWEKMARKDKARYEVEKALYKGPWKVPANKRTPKDPTAPKRPMSAFLAFSNKRRAALKRENPDATNADLSKMLSKTWKEAPDDLRKKYMDEEADLRAKYKVSMAAWRKKVAEEKRQEREEREAVAMKHAEDQQNDLQQQSQQQTQQQQQQQQSDTSQSVVDQSQLFYPYMAQMGNLLATTGGMPNNGDPSQQYANMLAANNFAQQQFSLPQQQQQLLSQLFNAQQFKYPNMNGVNGMYPGLQGQFAFQGQPMATQGMQGMSANGQGLSMQQQAAQNFAMQQQQLQQQLAMAQAMQQQQQQPMMDHQQQQEEMMMDNAQQQYDLQYQDGDNDDDDDNDEQDSVKDDDSPPYGVSL